MIPPSPAEQTAEIRPILAADSRPIRAVVLRPGRPPEDAAFDDDDAPDTLHVGGFMAGRLVAVGRVSREPSPGDLDPDSWRVRGMATLPESRSHGIGTAVLASCVAHAAERGAKLVWCNARVPAVPFYERSGFEPTGEAFEIEGIGPHRLMIRRLSDQFSGGEEHAGPGARSMGRMRKEGDR